MSSPDPSAAQTAAKSPPVSAGATLAPPNQESRPSSANSSRSSSSRRRNGKKSGSVSPAGSDTNRSGNRVVTNGTTTTVSGGVKLGGQNSKQQSRSPVAGENIGEKKDAKETGGGQGKGKAKKGGLSSQQKNGSGGNQGSRPQPIDTGAPPRPTSSNSTKSETPAQPRSLHAHVSPPRSAMDAAFEAAHQKHHDIGGGNALTSLQKMISDLKAISPSSSTPSSSLPSAPPTGRSMSVSQGENLNLSAPPVTIPSAGGKKLKADAPSFTPSLSPGASNVSLSPNNTLPLPSAQGRSASFAAGSNQRRQSTNSNAANNAGFSSPPPGSFSSGMPHMPLSNIGFQNSLSGLPQANNEGMSPFGIDFAYQQQLLAAQYQQIQLLQAQIQANQVAQQQAQQQQQQQQSTSFIAPRFQALAAQRIQQQQEQQAQLYQAHAQAQQVYQIQQQQMLDQQSNAHKRSESADAPPVFEEDSPEQKPVPLGTSGRPQLNPNFTFGAKRQNSDRESMSPPMGQAPIINRSEGIGGAAATGLAGLAARAHKRTGSEITPQMQEQLDIQSQIEALQAKQKALMEGDRSSALNQLSEAIHKRTPSVGHRRAQSNVQMAAEPVKPVEEEPSASQPRQVIRGFGEMPPPPVPTSSGHSRRHSTVAPKGHRTSAYGSAFGSISSDMPDDFSQPMGHHRTGSRSGFESGNWRNVAQGPVTDLASAQAQLQSLAQFRAAAGGGHHQKMASFAFPNMMPNLLAATTLQTPAGQSLIEQQQAFQMQLQQNNQGPQRKSLFAPYLPQASLPPLLQAGKLVVGFLRVNKKNRSDAYVATDVLEADIYICGSKDRNRALEGDIVAVELLDVDEVWGTKKEKEDKKRRKEENAAYDLKPSTVKRLEKKKDDVEVEGQGMTLFDDEEVNDDTKPTYAGHVVAVVERMPGQLFSGQLGVLRPSSAATKEKQEIERREREGDRAKRDEPEAKPRIVWFKPTDKRVPLIAIPTEQAPSDFIENPDAYSERLFVATIKRWPITSLHPFGTLVEELGPIGDAEVETSALLKDCNFPTEEFNDMAIKCLPPLPWSIPEREFEIRKDLRSDRVFTIDPPSAKDMDDALSIKKNEDGTFDVNVHIADVSYFVKTNTALDREARKRAISVYLVQRAVPMLPPQLCEELCSLVPGEERLAFTASFKLDSEANVLEKSFSRTIIKSCAKLAYSDAQNVISGSKLSVQVDGEHQSENVEEDIRNLNLLASKLRARRLEAGAMLGSKLKIRFTLDDKSRPTDCEPTSLVQANSLVEEFMLLTNLAVSQVIANGLPEQSLLRRHEQPLERRLEGFVRRAKKLGFDMDGSSSGALQKSFDKVEDPNAMLCLEMLKRKSMQSAKYFCTGMLDIAKFSHYALNAPIYTHFTSPIRRYADVLVHRMLDACISAPNPNEVKFHMDRDQVAKCAQQCNMKKQSARLAEDQSIHLHLCMLIHDLTLRYGPVIRQGIVTGVLDAAFDVVIPEYGLEKRVHADKMPLSNTVYDEHKDVLSLYWTKQDTISYLAETSDDPHIQKIKTLSDRRATGNLTTQSTDTDALFSSSSTSAETSKQYQKSASSGTPQFDGLRKSGGHQIQDIKELMSVPVIITSDMTKSPPVLVVYASNPYA